MKRGSWSAGKWKYPCQSQTIRRPQVGVDTILPEMGLGECQVLCPSWPPYCALCPHCWCSELLAEELPLKIPDPPRQ